MPSPEKPLVISLCGTFLKPEMQSVYRQIVNLQRHRTVVFTEQHINREIFPFEPVITMKRMRPRGNFIKRFWFKHVLKQWPPPVNPNKPAPVFHPWNLPELLRQHAPELVHVYYGHKAVQYLPMIEAWGGPMIVSFHGVDVARRVDDPDYVKSLARVFECARLVLARSESLLERVASLGCPRGKLRLNRTPIPIEHIEFAQREAPANGEWRLVQACRLIEKKGLLTTIEALSEVVREWPRAKFVIAGEGPLGEKLREAAASAGLSANVEMAGWRSQPELMQLYAESHLFLHPSETTRTGDQEGIPNSMLEAMASGLPVVATQHGGIPEAVTDGVEGFLVPEKSPDKLAAALLQLMRNPGQLQQFSQSAAASVREKFGLALQVARLEECYAEACKSLIPGQRWP